MLILLNKPYGVLCQFTDRSVPPKPTLADFVRVPDVYPAGRLDFDSEGLVVLTDDGALAHRLTDPRHKLAKTYLVQVEGTPNEAALERLRRGVMLNDGPTLPASGALPASCCSYLVRPRPGRPALVPDCAACSKKDHRHSPDLTGC